VARRAGLTRFNSAAYEPPSFDAGYQPINLGVPGPRTSVTGEMEANCPRIWPAQYPWRLMGLGAMPRFQLGITAPIFDNQFAPYAPGFNVEMPGLAREPFGG
jgi:hypothetical protein